VGVVVLDQGVASDLAADAANGDHAELTLEGHEALDDQRRAAQALERRARVSQRTQHRLPFTVIAEAPGLEHRRQPDAFEGGHELVPAGHRLERRGTDAERAEAGLFVQPVLRHLERAGARANPDLGLERSHRRHWHIFEFERHHVGTREHSEGVLVGIVTRQQRPDRGRGRFGVRIQKCQLEAERATGKAEHAPQLPAAQDADACTERGRHARGSGLSSTL
jgi:hypothetical protein